MIKGDTDRVSPFYRRNLDETVYFSLWPWHEELFLDESKVIKEVDMPAVKPLTDIKQAVLDAIYHPIDRSQSMRSSSQGYRDLYLQ